MKDTALEFFLQVTVEDRILFNESKSQPYI